MNNVAGKLFVALVLLATPFSASAHPGHGQTSDGYGVVHYLTETLHVLPVVLLVVVVLLAIYCLRGVGSRSKS